MFLILFCRHRVQIIPLTSLVLFVSSSSAPLLFLSPSLSLYFSRVFKNRFRTLLDSRFHSVTVEMPLGYGYFHPNICNIFGAMVHSFMCLTKQHPFPEIAEKRRFIPLSILLFHHKQIPQLQQYRPWHIYIQYTWNNIAGASMFIYRCHRKMELFCR